MPTQPDLKPDVLEIRALRRLADMHAVVELQRAYWGDSAESVIPAHMLFSLANYGGHVLTAFDGDRPIGVLVGFLGTHSSAPPRPAMANLQIVSKRMVVLPEYRGTGIGYRLKLRQRELAIEQGIRLVEWTFDPLLSLNAHLNVRKLGVICPTYLQDYYGTSNESGLALMGSSDRVTAQWWVTNRRVEERLFGKRADLSLQNYRSAQAPLVNPATSTSDGSLRPAESVDWSIINDRSLVLVEIPRHYAEMARMDAVLAVRWRSHSRDVLQTLFQRGFVITDFLSESVDGVPRSYYVLSFDGNPQSSERTLMQ
jgi:predicted GNAT superfamily acetyltransferase